MQAFTTYQGIVLPLDQENVNTDVVIPARYLKKVTRSGFAEGLFANWRYQADGSLNPDFVLNMPRYQGASILLAGENFGCGSSREHAPWALEEYGFRVLIAPSFGDIFYNNCLNIGLLPIRLPVEDVRTLFRIVEANEGYSLKVDLPDQKVIDPSGQVWHFEIDGHNKEMLLHGLDMIAHTLRYQTDINAFEDRQRAAMPWQIT